MSNGRIWVDKETKSEFDIAGGVWEYSLHPSTEIINVGYRIRHPGQTVSTEPARVWHPGEPVPVDMKCAALAGYEVEAHNYSFEHAMWTNVAMPRFNFPAIRPEQWRDTMATACYYGMPAKLDGLLRALKMPPKDPEGSRLITKYSKLYLKTAKRVIPPEDMMKWDKYVIQDVLSEERVSDYLGDLPDREIEIFLLDQIINLRGLRLDLTGIASAAKIVEGRAAELTAKFRDLTGLNPTQRDKIMAWCAERQVVLENFTADYLEDLLEEGMPRGEVREALTIRLKINKASTKKLAKMATEAASTGRAYWQSRYHGAMTGRPTGAGFQPLNLVKSWEHVDPDRLVQDIGYGNARYLDAVYGDAMDAISHASRHWVQASEGNRIVAGDFVSIEAVILACLAGEQWRIDAFRAKKRIYSLMGDKIHHLPEGTTKKGDKADADGKKGELAFGYQGALGAWLKFDDSGSHSDEEILAICKEWRLACPNITAFWAGLQSASIEAVRTGGVRGFRDISFECVDEWLTMILPDGKRLWYREPELKLGWPHWHQPATKLECREGSCRCQQQPQLSYMSQKEGQWRRVKTYGGKLTENCCQAVSNRFLNPSVKAAEKRGYPVVLTVYDEVVADVPLGFGSKKEFEEILLDVPGREWAAGWPIGVDVWEGPRYKKA